MSDFISNMFRHLRWGGQQDSCCYEMRCLRCRRKIASCNFRRNDLPQILTNQACTQHPFPISGRLNKCWRSEAPHDFRASLPQRAVSARKAVGGRRGDQGLSSSVWPPAKPFSGGPTLARPGWRAQLVDGCDRAEPLIAFRKRFSVSLILD